MLLILLVLLAATLPAGGPTPTAGAGGFEIERATWRDELPEGKPIEVTNPHGDVRVRPAVGSTIEVFATIQRQSGDPVRVPLVTSVTADRVLVGVSYPGSPRPELVRRVDLVVFAPPASPLAVVTVSGLLEVRGVAAPLEASTDYGRVVLDTAGPVQVRSREGRVELRLAPGSRWEGPAWIRTDSGDVRVVLPEDVDLTVEATTTGAVTCELSAELEPDPATRMVRVRMVVGHGGPTLRLASLEGDISVRRRR